MWIYQFHDNIVIISWTKKEATCWIITTNNLLKCFETSTLQCTLFDNWLTKIDTIIIIMRLRVINQIAISKKIGKNYELKNAWDFLMRIEIKTVLPKGLKSYWYLPSWYVQGSVLFCARHEFANKKHNHFVMLVKSPAQSRAPFTGSFWSLEIFTNPPTYLSFFLQVSNYKERNPLFGNDNTIACGNATWIVKSHAQCWWWKIAQFQHEKWFSVRNERSEW